MSRMMVLAAAALAATVTTASAATIGFDTASSGATYTEDGMIFAPIRIVNGNCPGGDAPCGALNDNESTTVTAQNDAIFDALSLSFRLQGNGNRNALYLETDNGTFKFGAPDYQKNTDYVLDLTSSLFNGAFDAITYLKLFTMRGGNVRFDDLTVEVAPAPVPLPAGGALLLGGLGALALARRRRAA